MKQAKNKRENPQISSANFTCPLSRKFHKTLRDSNDVTNQRQIIGKHLE